MKERCPSIKQHTCEKSGSSIKSSLLVKEVVCEASTASQDWHITRLSVLFEPPASKLNWSIITKLNRWVPPKWVPMRWGLLCKRRSHPFPLGNSSGLILAARVSKHTDALIEEQVASTEGKTDCKHWNSDDWGGYERILSPEILHSSALVKTKRSD